MTDTASTAPAVATATTISTPSDTAATPIKFIPHAQWEPDEKVSACPACRLVFTMVERKHHCRICGRIFCNKCSPKIFLSETDDPTRICNECCVKLKVTDEQRQFKGESLQDKFARGLIVYKQKLKQAMGLSQGNAQSETPEFVAMLASLKDTTSSFLHLLRVTKSLYDTHHELENDIVAFLETECHPALRLKKKYEDARLEYLARVDTVVGIAADKRETYYAKVDEAKQFMEKFRSQLRAAIQSMDAKRDIVYNSVIVTMCKTLQDCVPLWTLPQVSTHIPIVSGPLSSVYGAEKAAGEGGANGAVSSMVSTASHASAASTGSAVPAAPEAPLAPEAPEAPEAPTAPPAADVLTPADMAHGGAAAAPDLDAEPLSRQRAPTQSHVEVNPPSHSEPVTAPAAATALSPTGKRMPPPRPPHTPRQPPPAPPSSAHSTETSGEHSPLSPKSPPPRPPSRPHKRPPPPPPPFRRAPPPEPHEIPDGMKACVDCHQLLKTDDFFCINCGAHQPELE